MQRIILVSKFFVTVVALLGSACIDRGSPVFREFTRDEEQRANNAVERAIKESESVRRLFDVCRSTPFFSAKFPNSRSIITKNSPRTLLTFHYSIQSDVESVFAEVREQLVAEGWAFILEENGIWERQIEFSKDGYRIQIAHGNFGESNYAVNCEN